MTSTKVVVIFDSGSVVQTDKYTVSVKVSLKQDKLTTFIVSIC